MAAAKPNPTPSTPTPPAPSPEELKPAKTGIVYKDRKGRLIDPNGFLCDENGVALEGQ